MIEEKKNLQTKKMNFELAISRSFNKVTLSILNKPINYETEEKLRANIKKRYTLLLEEIEEAFKRIK